MDIKHEVEIKEEELDSINHDNCSYQNDNQILPNNEENIPIPEYIKNKEEDKTVSEKSQIRKLGKKFMFEEETLTSDVKFESPKKIRKQSNDQHRQKINSVSSLLSKNFNLRPSKEKLEIRNLGRSTPALNIKQIVKSKNREFKRIFKLSIYEKHKWICGCDVRNSLHCFPCLLFGGEDKWTKIGVKDINHLASNAKRHEITKVHMENALRLSLFGKLNIAEELDGEYRKSIQKHNENVKNNRYILNIIINCIKFCGAFELALRGSNEIESSTTPGVFRELVNFSAELDNSLRVHLEKATVFKGTSKTIQNELLQIILETCHEEIVREIHEADFLSVIVDETSDVSNIYQMVVIFRYIVKGKPIERFWNFIAPKKHDTETLITSLLKEIERLNINKEKLISQTYDGANVLRGSSGGVQVKLRQIYPQAEYIHSHAHQLNLVMLNAASVNRNVRIFFANLQAICEFFSTSPNRIAVLDLIVNKVPRLPSSIYSKWNFHSRSVNTVFENKEVIKVCLKDILSGNEFQDVNTISLASGHIMVLESNNFNFWLSFFHKIMPSVDILYSNLQKRYINPSSIKMYIDNFEKKLLSIREDYFQGSTHNEEMERETGISDLNREAKEICDTIICQIKDRFKFTGHLIAATLFLPVMFAHYNSRFPYRKLNETCKMYPLLDIKKLRIELSLIYSTEEFRSMSGAVALLDFITENKLDDTFSECVKILKILITIPMTTSEAERCFSTLKKIKTFVRNTMGQERLSALAMLSVEKEFVMNISDFNRKVIDKFANSYERRADFLFK